MVLVNVWRATARQGENMKEFRKRDGDIEIRSCNDNLLQTGEHTTAEIVQWYKKDNCITIAFFEKEEGWEFRLMLDRFYGLAITQQKTLLKMILFGYEKLRGKE